MILAIPTIPGNDSPEVGEFHFGVVKSAEAKKPGTRFKNADEIPQGFTPAPIQPTWTPHKDPNEKPEDQPVTPTPIDILNR